MAQSVSKKQGRRRLSKYSKPENFPREQENIDPKSKERSPTPSTSKSIPRITITPPSSVLHMDSCSKTSSESFLYFITYTGCAHMGSYRKSKSRNKIFESELEPYAISSAFPIKIVETYIFDKPCPGCNPTSTRVLNENPKTLLASPSMPFRTPDESFIAFMVQSERYAVSWPIVQPMVPDAIRRFGKFDFEDDEDQAQGEHEKKVDGSDRSTSLRSYKTTDLMPMYLEDLRTPAKDPSMSEEELDTRTKESCTPAKKSKARRRWRKVRMVSRKAILPKELSVK